jgi:4-amino-4-deoxy-L-arabinose transferase-like glycosyltransferase
MVSLVTKFNTFSSIPAHSFFQSGETRAMLLLIVVALLIRLPLVLRPFSEAHDSWREADTASIAHNFYDQSNPNILYPQINWGGNGPGYVETEFQLYTYIVALLYGIFGEHPNFGPLVSLTFSILTLPVFYLLARRFLQPRAAQFALAFLIIAPLYIRYTTTFMPESTVFFFYVLSLYLFQKWLDTEALPILILAGISTALAVLVKPTSIHIGLIFFLLLVQKFRSGLFKRWDLWLFAVISLTPAALWYLHARNLYLTYGNTFGLLSGGDSKFGDLSYYLRPSFYWAVARIDLTAIFAYGGAPLFLLGLVISLRKNRLWLLFFGLIAIAAYYMIVARYIEFAPYYHIFLLPYAALGFGLGLDWIINRIRTQLSLKKPDWLPYALTTAICLGVMVVFISNSYANLLADNSQELVECANHVADLVPPDARIIVSTTSYQEYNGVENNYQEPQIFFFSHRQGWSLPAEWHTPEKLEEYRRDGATYFVIYSAQLYSNNRAMARYLAENAEQMGPGVAMGCGVFRFNS